MSFSVRPRSEQCIGCLGNRQCWICLGQGRLERANGSYDTCERCTGSGRCALCSGTGPAQPTPIGPPVLHLDAPAEVTLLP